MQDFLTLAIEAIATVSAIYFVAGFVAIAGRPVPVPTATQTGTDEVEATVEVCPTVEETLTNLSEANQTIDYWTEVETTSELNIVELDPETDDQITALRLADNFPLECRTLLTSPTETPKNNSSRKKKTQAKNMAQPATITRSSRYPQGVVPKPTQTTPKKPSVLNLRNLCSTNKIKWKNAHGKNRHLTQNQMISVLEDKGLTL
jgi:hypothetical protein